MTQEASQPLLRRALALHLNGELQQAQALYEQIVRAQPDHFDALQLLGAVFLSRQDPHLALDYLERALQVQPDGVNALANQGVALRRLGRLEDAVQVLERTVSLKPNHAEAQHSLGNALSDLGRYDDALRAYDAVLKHVPGHTSAWFESGRMCLALSQPEEAGRRLKHALSLGRADAALHACLGEAHRQAGRQTPAQTSFEAALRLDPHHLPAVLGKARVDVDQGRYESALTALNAAPPTHAFAAEHALLRGYALLGARRHDEAVDAFEEAAHLGCQEPRLAAFLFHTRMKVCDWTNYSIHRQQVIEQVKHGSAEVEPFALLAITDDPELHLKAASFMVATRYPARALLPADQRLEYRQRLPEAKVRVAYLSGEFRHQATSMLMVEMLESHDRERFEIIALDNGWDDGSALRQRLTAAVADFRDIKAQTDLELAREIRDSGVDILVNLNGFFGRMRQGVFAYRPAPIQVNFLGYPGSLGADYIDYIIADREVIPPALREQYREKVVWMPLSYQPNDSQRGPLGRAAGRQTQGLPEESFVYCCFNNNYKITPDHFALWMSLLQATPGSVLWLLKDSDAAAGNLQREAQRLGVDPKRIVWAGRMPTREHLDRHQLADLFLDTWPCNAHTTASDCLWAGLPLVTLRGQAFASRVAASLLQALGLPELIANTPEEYLAAAIRLYRQPEELARLRALLREPGRRARLFDGRTYARSLEEAFRQMMLQLQCGRAPDHIDLPELLTT